MSVYKTKFYGEYKFSDNATPYLLTYLSKFFRTIHIERDVEKIKESYYNWKDYSYYGDLGYEGELYVNPEDKSYGNKNLLAVTKWCHFAIEKREDGNFLIWNGNKRFYHYEAWIQYIIDRFLQPHKIELNGVMLEIGMGSTDANYMVLYENRLFKYYAKDPRELERLRNDFKDSDIILDTMNKIPPLSSL